MATVCLLCLLLLPLTSRAVIQIKSDGGYEDIVVAIHSSIPPDERVITNIKSLFSSASDLLHDATNGRVYFSQVTISVPSTWPQRPEAESVNSDFFQYADIRVKEPNPHYGSIPYTLQPRRCGEPGEYIHLTADFLLNAMASKERPYDTPAFQLLQQWAHFRYGIFEDYGIQDDILYPVFYCSHDKVRANTFPRHVPFHPETRNGATCKIYRNCRVSKECVAAALPHDATLAQSSAMYIPKPGEDEPQYDSFSPTKQNIICRRSPPFGVIRRHSDFNGLAKPQLVNNVTEVKFREVQQSTQNPERVVMVLDVSVSMNEHERMEYLKRSASYFVKNLAPDYLQLGIVTFSRSSTVLQELVTVDSRTRQRLLDLIANLAMDSATAIGQGLQTALQVLQQNGTSTEGTSIILMTDGEENVEPYIETVLPSLVDAKVHVSGLGLGAEADKQLETLADVTGGRVFFFKDRQENIELAMESAFQDSATIHLEEYRKPIIVLENSLHVANDSKVHFTIDDDLGNDTAVTIVSTSLEDIEITLLEPSGDPCSTCQNKTDTVLSKRMTITVPTPAKNGTWTLITSCKSTDPVHISVRVSSIAKSKEAEPIRLRAFLNRPIVTHPEEARIYAEVTKGKDAVARARVQAKVTRPNDDADVQVELWDNGFGADVTADDGIYSSYFTQFTGIGRYSVEVRVENGGSALQLTGRRASGAVPPFTAVVGLDSREVAKEFPRSTFRFIDADIAEMEDISGARLPEFQRFATGGSFRLEDDIKAISNPPSPIEDLSVINEQDRFDSYVVTLSWTCPGQHFDVSGASSIEIRTSDNLTALLSDFESGRNVTSTVLHPAGTRQDLIVTLQKDHLQHPKLPSPHTVYIAARVRNSDGMASDVSNFVSVQYYYSTLLKLGDFTIGHWAALLAPCILFVFLVIILLSLSCRKRRPRPTSLRLVRRQQSVSTLGLVGNENRASDV
ncbi:calcium-activated chloride channel regulator 1-like [Ornithodoros turicata]|uniref:calcium-activated chloride channel regulator 1-like n=1 Tax=Ornithodoros turicata TaxID=34597 RepID=UPI003139E4FB